MFVSDWMTPRVYTTNPDECIANVMKMMKELRIRHIPVMAGERIKGIVSEGDLKAYIPTRVSPLDMYELNHILENTAVLKVMKKDVFTTSPEIPIEEAAMVMYDNRIGCLPVERDGELVGIISDRDIFRALIDITGVRNDGHRISLIVDERPRGAIKEIADTVRRHGFGIQSILSSFQKVEKGSRNIVIRTKGSGQYGALKAELMGSYRDVRFRKGG